MTTFHGNMRGDGLRFALICSRFNDLIVGRLEAGARDALVRHGVDNDAIDTIWVPGALEIPHTAKVLASSGRYDAIVALGAVMRGATYHFEVVCNQSAAGLMRVGLDTGVPCAFGILTCDTMAQAEARAGGDKGNKGDEAADAAVSMINLLAAARDMGPGGASRS
jgi:6,7-dimethyl-8-ribityllumazine synthase